MKPKSYEIWAVHDSMKNTYTYWKDRHTAELMAQIESVINNTPSAYVTIDKEWVRDLIPDNWIAQYLERTKNMVNTYKKAYPNIYRNRCELETMLKEGKVLSLERIRVTK